jgi:diguanylate cyclase (GGDEF)-like protein/PAS domain S-box-containing protein
MSDPNGSQSKSMPLSKEKKADLFATELMEHLAVAAFVLDNAGRVLIWNKACERLTGVPAPEVIGTADHWKALYDKERPCLADLLLQGRLEEAKELYEAWSDTEVNPHGLSAENWCVMPRLGKRCYLAFDVGPIYDDHGDTIAVVETLRDLSAHKRMETELEDLAGRDSLTSISNRRTFDRRLDEEWRRAMRNETPLSLLIIDVDYFKQFNDAHGHHKGDECLKLVARCVQNQALRAGDVAARIGGEEYALILPHTPNEDAALIAERVRQTVEAMRMQHAASPISRHVTVSVGVMTTQPGMDIHEFVTMADIALYAAKKNGRNRVENHVAREQIATVLRLA